LDEEQTHSRYVGNRQILPCQNGQGLGGGRYGRHHLFHPIHHTGQADLGSLLSGRCNPPSGRGTKKLPQQICGLQDGIGSHQPTNPLTLWNNSSHMAPCKKSRYNKMSLGIHWKADPTPFWVLKRLKMPFLASTLWSSRPRMRRTR